MPTSVARRAEAVVRLIDVLWLTKGERIVTAFGVEHDLGYSGIVRMLDRSGARGAGMPGLFWFGGRAGARGLSS